MIEEHIRSSVLGLVEGEVTLKTNKTRQWINYLYSRRTW